mmetsp:Transcript_37763/g.85177  ORF Transcript_37763/g.85177 Transcript_37763/m.85177 type:complete len:366 (+) Transcript_37763:1-1098(+)
MAAESSAQPTDVLEFATKPSFSMTTQLEMVVGDTDEPCGPEDMKEVEMAAVAPKAEVDVEAGRTAAATTGDPVQPTASAAAEAEWADPRRRRVLILERVTYAIVSCGYFVYRSRGSPTFTHHAFRLKPNDAWGILFAIMFGITRRASYLVYAINPFRNLVLVALQEMFTNLQVEETGPEFWRDIISTVVQLSSALLIKRLVAPKPIGLGTQVTRAMPFASDFAHRLLSLIFTAVFVISALVMVFLGAKQHTDDFANYGFSDFHGRKIVLAVLLGTSEEVTWREAYLDDNNNFLQAFTWGMNHLVVGEGMDNPFVYGLVSFLYAFVLGLSEYRLARYSNHSAIEYLIMDNLVKVVRGPRLLGSIFL